MAKVDMTCPRCGKNATEYAQNKWQCLGCGAKFLYDPNAPEKLPRTRKSLSDNETFAIMIVALVLLSVIGVWLSNRHDERMAEISATTSSTNTTATVGEGK